MIKSIMFDLGNVVLTNDSSKGNKALTHDFYQLFSITEEDISRSWEKLRPDLRVGKLTEEDFWEKFLIGAGAKNPDVEKCKKIWRKYQAPVNDMFSLLEKLKPKYKLVAVANIGKEFLEFKTKKFNLNKYFHEIIGSGDCGFGKPGKEIYLLALKKANFEPEECLFVDDKLKNIEAAKELGINGILFESKEQLIKEFKNYNIN